MSINVNTGGLWKEATPFVRPAGSWKQADAYVRQGGMWYQSSSQGMNILIDSATPLHDFNLKTWMQGAGLWPESGPVIIDELTVTARTHITTSERSAVVPVHASYLTDLAAPPMNTNGFKWMKRVIAAGTMGSGQTQPLYNFMFAQELNRYAFNMGTGWPVGSVVNTFNVQGYIYGRGGDGDCSIVGNPYQVPGGKAYDWYANNGTYYDANILLCQSGHGDHGLNTASVVIKTLNVTGGVYGGGAGASLNRMLCTKEANTVYIANPPPASEPFDQSTLWGLAGTVKTGFLSFEPLGWWTTASRGRFNSDTGLIEILKVYSHGYGGGQGGGRGGVAQPMAPSATLTIQGEVQSGGNGTFDSIGASPSNVAQFTNNDKYSMTYRAETLITPIAGSWGQDSTFGKVKDLGPTYSLTTAAVDIGLASTPSSLNTFLPYGYKGGTAIKGVGSITSILNPTNIKGAQKA